MYNIAHSNERVGIMKKLNNTTKAVLIGVGAAVTVGASILAYFLASDEAQDKAKSVVNRERAKLFVQNKIGNSEKASSVVEQLSDSEVNNLVSSVNETEELENKLSEKTPDISGFLGKKAKKVLK